MNLKQELRNSHMSMEVARSNVEVPEVNNVDILRRLSQLENGIW